jgi:hypothetical protein
MAPQFASPEQLQNCALDFRSEIYSLGATMCFLLTGAVPLASIGGTAGLRTRRLPELRPAPKALRTLLAYMLRENPGERPQDPVLFEQEIRKCLAKVERHQAIRRKLGIPIAAVIPRPPSKESKPLPTPAMQIVRGALVFVALLLTAALVAAFLLPKGTIPFLHATRGPDKIGVPVGVPDAAATAQTASAPVVASRSPLPKQSAPDTANQSATNSSPPPVESDASSPAQIASTTLESKPEQPTEGPDENSATQQRPTSKQASENATSDSDSSSRSGSKTIASNSKRRSTSQRARGAQSSPDEFDAGTPRGVRSGSVHARFLGKTADGRRILRLPSGRIVVVTPGAPDEELDAPQRYHNTERPRPQPFYPPGYTPYD